MSAMHFKKVAIVVAHPDDETLWAGGTILCHPSWHSFIVCLCRKSDADRAPKFYKVLKELKAEGIMGDLEKGPDQHPLNETEVESTILELLPPTHFDLIITHSPFGEYTRHIRHEETANAVIQLWTTGQILSKELWLFAYEDGYKQYHPRPIPKASIYKPLSKRIWQKKYKIMTEIYGFEKHSWEAETTPEAEAFWQFTDANVLQRWLIKDMVNA